MKFMVRKTTETRDSGKSIKAVILQTLEVYLVGVLSLVLLILSITDIIFSCCNLGYIIYYTCTV